MNAAFFVVLWLVFRDGGDSEVCLQIFVVREHGLECRGSSHDVDHGVVTAEVLVLLYTRKWERIARHPENWELFTEMRKISSRFFVHTKFDHSNSLIILISFKKTC